MYLIALLFSFWSAQAQSLTHAELAQKHAPIILQHRAFWPSADVFTRFNYDGDWNGENNWQNLSQFKIQPSMYYSVIESETHYFISYILFYPRDYHPLCFTTGCHENDIEGLRITVDKKNIDEVWLFELQHHGKLTREHRPWRDNGHVVVLSEGGKHGLNPVGPGRYLVRRLFKRYDPKDYELVPLSEMWEKRDEVGDGKIYAETFDYHGARFGREKLPFSFAGKKYEVNAANPPWAWQLDKQLAPGDWFIDPAWSTCRLEGCPSDFSLKYVVNPFLQE